MAVVGHPLGDSWGGGEAEMVLIAQVFVITLFLILSPSFCTISVLL